MHWPVSTPAEVVNWRGGPGVALAAVPLLDGTEGCGVAGRLLAWPVADGVAVPSGDSEAGSLDASAPEILVSRAGAGGWTSPPTPPITVSASMLTATDATAPTVHAAAPVKTRRGIELTGPPSHGA
jgi:hypothetical protein